jgi:hypothetical protein
MVAWYVMTFSIFVRHKKYLPLVLYNFAVKKCHPSAFLLTWILLNNIHHVLCNHQMFHICLSSCAILPLCLRVLEPLCYALIAFLYLCMYFSFHLCRGDSGEILAAADRLRVSAVVSPTWWLASCFPPFIPPQKSPRGGTSLASRRSLRRQSANFSPNSQLQPFLILTTGFSWLKANH